MSKRLKAQMYNLNTVLKIYYYLINKYFNLKIVFQYSFNVQFHDRFFFMTGTQYMIPFHIVHCVGK